MLKNPRKPVLPSLMLLPLVTIIKLGKNIDASVTRIFQMFIYHFPLKLEEGKGFQGGYTFYVKFLYGFDQGTLMVSWVLKKETELRCDLLQ